MKLSNLHTISSFILILLLFSTCKMKKTFLEDYKDAWLHSYQVKDTVIFSTDNSSIIMCIDTIFINNPRNDNPYDWEDTSFERYFEYSDRITGWGKINIGNINHKYKDPNYMAWAEVFFSAENDYDIFNSFWFRVGDLQIDDRNIKLLNRLKDSYHSNDSDCIIRASDYMTEKDPNDSITDFVWSRERGLLSFTVRDTATYRLVKRIPKSLKL